MGLGFQSATPATDSSNVTQTSCGHWLLWGIHAVTFLGIQPSFKNVVAL